MKTRQEVKVWLRSHNDLQSECDDIEKTLNNIRAERDRLKAQVLTGMPIIHGSKASAQERTVMILDDMEFIYEQKNLQSKKAIKEIETAISSVESIMHRRILRLKYIDGLKWQDVSDRIIYGWSRTHELHNEAIDMILRIVSDT